MMEKKKRIRNSSITEIKCDDEILELKNVFIGGRMADEQNTLVGFYSGVVDIGEMGVSLMSLLRGVLKTVHSECGLPHSKSVEFVKECLLEAVAREITDSLTLDQEANVIRTQRELQEIVNRFMKNQKRP